MQFLKVIGVSSLTAVYCLAVVLGCFAPLKTSLPSAWSGDTSSTTVSIASDLHQPAGLAPRISMQSTAKAPDTSNESGLDHAAVLRSATRLVALAYRQYTGYSYPFPVRTRKADLIFPFHYFW